MTRRTQRRRSGPAAGRRGSVAQEGAGSDKKVQRSASPAGSDKPDAKQEEEDSEGDAGDAKNDEDEDLSEPDSEQTTPRTRLPSAARIVEAKKPVQQEEVNAQAGARSV